MRDDSFFLRKYSLQDYELQIKMQKGANLKELPRPYKLPQSALAESVEGGVKLSKTCLPTVGPPCHRKILEKG